MIDINNFDAISIGLASSKQIRSWSSGEVTKPETINYRTLKPEKDGLFCERIFGPTKDWECYCGKYKRVRYKGIVCERCGVEVTRSKVRRERMGHIDLAAPVSHIWFFKGVPSRIGYLLDMAPKELEKVLYFAASIVTWVDEEARQKDLDKLEKEVQKVLDSYAAEKEERILELRESLERRVAYLQSGDQSGFSDDDHLWADTLDVNVKKLSDEDREKMIKDLRKTFDADIADTEAYIEDAAERMRQVWDVFREMKPKDVIADETLFRELKDRFGSPYGFGEYFRGGMGAEAVRDLLEQVDLEAERAELEEQVKTAKGQKQSRAVKRLKVVSAFINSDNKPEHMILEAIPVIPPELRPMVQLDGGRFATSDLNDLYRRVINRNNRLKRLLDLGAPEIIVNNEKRMLQEAVDALFDNGRRGRPVTGPGNRPLKSLSDMLKGKQGRFRQNLLGKRVDYSGRSVIVAGPSLKLHQCGLPKLMALELFKPFIMARLVERKAVQNIKAAKKMVDSMIPEVWDVLEEVIQEHPVLLNRAPTLHRLGLQAFEPVLVEGKAIQVHPLVCHAFNADFDGDQMAVHLPLSAEAQAEARVLMLSANNILSPAHGAPLATPSQDMVLGTYYLTYGPGPQELQELEELVRSGKWDEKKHGKRPHVFRSSQEAELSYEHGMVNLHDLAEYRRKGMDASSHILTTVGRIIFNDRVERALADTLGDAYDPSEYEFVNQALRKRDLNGVIERLVERHGPYAIALVLDAFKDLGFHFATQAGITISKNDIVVPPQKAEILDRYEAEVAEIQEQYEMGLISQEERHDAVVEKWNAATDEVGEAMQRNLDELNPIFMMANSGARGSFKQIRQLAGMRGLMANPKGEIIERPIKANFMEGLSVLEYFVSTHGARKGLADTALRTADSGYLTRRLVDVAQDVIVRLEDCGTEEYVELPALDEAGRPNQQLVGRYVAHEFKTKRGRTLVEADTMITREHLEAIVEAFGDEPALVPVRSVLKCQADAGVCQRCYGLAMATGKEVAIGDAVGIIAAQSIGEPGTQLTLRTFHTGGVAGLDITQGLPRVVELFEARKPKGLAALATVDGTVSVEDTEKALKVTITDAAGEEHSYSFPRRTRLLVEPGDKVKVGDQLNEGSIYPAELLETRGRTATELYLVREVQRVYQSQGVEINDKHVEIIVRQMMKKVRVEQKGDSSYLPGQLVDRHEFLRENERIEAEGGEPAQYEEVILGITKASLATDSFLSAASFQETTKVLTDAALEGKTDRLLGLKENVIIGKLIPAATGLRRYRRLEIEPAEPVARPAADDIGLLDEGDLAAELGLTDGDFDNLGFGDGGDSAAFGEELADLANPPEQGEE
ncbi:MAG: DNA-directed RNA polymerase subunit beta' [Thermoleophilaceae bacterium]|nr:DNA-directed RNA polymerase subunit beta' [Thermoleophilaceae bacterium]